MIPITRPFIPPIDDYTTYLEGIWDRKWLTNNGPLVRELESELNIKLKTENNLLVNNGTLALQLAFKALKLHGEVITTPFSYIATTSSLIWEGLKPIFADVDSESLNISPKSIEEKITKNTTAILATHVYGNPCEIDSIDEIARKHNLKVIYDAAHAFGVWHIETRKNILSEGDISCISYHATKIFHTVEGGGIFTSQQHIHEDLSFLRNFGHDGPLKFKGVGINGKNSEFHAAMGLLNLRYIDRIIEKRKHLSDTYDERFKNTLINTPKFSNKYNRNYSYYAIILPDESLLLKIEEDLKKNSIGSRRYFYPALSNIDYVGKQKLPIVDDISCRVLCLPLYYDLETKDIEKIASIVLENLK